MDISTEPADPGNKDMALAGALFMVKLGARVLPVARRTKRALLKDWTQQASNDPDEVMGWAQHHPGCNWACSATRSQSSTSTSIRTARTAMSPWPRSRPSTASSETWCVHTPQGGRHYYFTQPKDRVRNLKRDDAGCEIRGATGYVLLPGSATPLGAYRWDPELHPDKVTRTVLPAYVQAFVAGTPMKEGQWGWPSGQPL